MMDVEIRPIGMCDFDGFYAALDAVARERRFLSSFEAPPVEGAASFVAGNIKNGNPQFVAIAGSEVIGWCDICRRSNAFFSHTGVMGMGIVSQFRGIGIGSRLLAAALNDAKSKHFRRVELEVFASNTQAIALYQRQEFVLEGTKRGAVLINDEEIDIHIMAITQLAG